MLLSNSLQCSQFYKSSSIFYKPLVYYSSNKESNVKRIWHNLPFLLVPVSACALTEWCVWFQGCTRLCRTNSSEGDQEEQFSALKLDPFQHEWTSCTQHQAWNKSSLHKVDKIRINSMNYGKKYYCNQTKSYLTRKAAGFTWGKYLMHIFSIR